MLANMDTRISENGKYKILYSFVKRQNKQKNPNPTPTQRNP